MRGIFPTLLITTILFAGGYFYYTASAVCDVPIAYRIGVLDARFNLSPEEARTVVGDAESIWEDATGRNLFTYDEDADFTVNFIFDNRQELTQIEQELRSQLTETENLSDAVRERYETLTSQYEELTSSYEEKRTAYEAELAAYNAEVSKWNDEGGAPSDVYEELTKRQEMLDHEQRELNGIVRQINKVADEINTLGERGNILVSTYNTVVQQYNNRFGHSHEGEEFTQGDYRGDSINIYEYSNMDELRIVLAHELGHALGLGHVENDASFMYYLMGEQDFSTGFTPEDEAEFARVCGEGNFTLFSARW